MSVEEFRNCCQSDRDSQFYRGSFNCAFGHFLNVIESLWFAIRYFIDTEDDDFKEFEECVRRLKTSLYSIENRMRRQTSKENTNG